MNYKEGALYAYANARSLLRAGKVVASTKCFGHATSLIVLSCEESIKSLSYWASYFDLPPDFILLGDGNLHTKRLGTGRIYDVIFHLTETGMLELLDESSFTLDGMVSLFETLIDTNNNEDVLAVKSWWNSANKLKQQGFYVDIIDQVSISRPSQITEEQYLGALSSAYKSLRIAQLSKIFCSSNKFVEDREKYIGGLKSLVSWVESNPEEFEYEIKKILSDKGVLET